MLALVACLVTLITFTFTFLVASIGDIALTQSDYSYRIAQAVTFMDNLEITSAAVLKNQSVPLKQRLQDLDSLAKLRRKITNDNEDIKDMLHKERRERRREQRRQSKRYLSFTVKVSWFLL